MVQSLDESTVLRGLGRFRRRMGAEMCEILPGLFLGSMRDATDEEQIKKNRIKCIVSVHDLSSSHPLHDNLRVLRVRLSDCPSVDIASYFSQTNTFIHEARLREESVLVHCLAGVSRSACVVVAYLLTVTDLSYYSALALVAARRPLINPNFGFRMQLAKFADKNVRRERDRLRREVGPVRFDLQMELDRHHVNGRRSRSTSTPQLTCDSGVGIQLAPLGVSPFRRVAPRSRVTPPPFRRASTLVSSNHLVSTFADMMGSMRFIDD